jgi:hypothetical protein
MVSVIALVALSAHGALAACDEDTIDEISEDGDLIVLSSGNSYDVDAGDESTASSWTENNDVLICDDAMINKDQNGEKISVTPH